MSEKESGPKQLSHAAAATKLMVQHGEEDRAVGLVAELGACLDCLCHLMLSFPLFWGGECRLEGEPRHHSASSAELCRSSLHFKEQQPKCFLQSCSISNPPKRA